ncbi:arginine vasopressin-induced protein 1 isoform X1 [Phyllostomus hastatus]|uniref:arginine vasopressin-induced protein 1 isoform X1 n=2 Tax=Phyllostomus hastatus TaxID=9423 RepID=UPI001E67F066|nr:arginine vasopressin-induced protein 1 isoform X1 [Phyllostomus hastatus]
MGLHRSGCSTVSSKWGRQPGIPTLVASSTAPLSLLRCRAWASVPETWILFLSFFICEMRRMKAPHRAAVLTSHSDGVRAPRMGTPASVVSEPLPGQAPPEARGRKQASANIFQDAELLQIQGLFQRSGDQLAEERAQIIWECAGDPRMAEALRRLRRKRPPRQKPLGHSLHHCSRLRIPEPHNPLADAQSSASSDQYLNTRRTSARIRRNWRKPGPTSYLHQIRH